MRFAMRAGTLIVPALFVVFMGLPEGAIPEDDPFAKPDTKPQVAERAPTPFEEAAGRVAGELRGKKDYLATRGAVDFALLLYAQSRRPEDLETAAALALRLRERDPASASALFRVAQAGGPGLAEAQAIFEDRKTADVSTMPTDVFATLVQDSFARALALRDANAVDETMTTARRFFGKCTRVESSRLIVLFLDDSPPSLSDYVETLRAALVVASVSGRVRMRNDLVSLGRELIRRFWDEDSGRFRDRRLDDTDDVALRLNAEVALALWEASFITGDPDLGESARRALETVLPEALESEEAGPAAALAAVRMDGHPVQMVLIGSAGDPKLRALREASSFLFEPRRVLLNLDPAVDTARIEELLYPAELAPVLFVCVETICSAPIQTAVALEGKVQEILKVAAGIQE